MVKGAAQQQKKSNDEESILSDKNIFAENANKSGLFNEIEWAVYCE